ncbi:hypothetical protein AXF42_Ash010713 [Apostasia shenzhenica]|uniref:Uncharacterized protein n=1 Tax=Apostasia shenzhenica TaxID=1088818 RepID=A0A2I0A6U7_9ASPA|nr:hypothetical protein AXF42_Ash010713 [Apostasia shenzhenica]
MKCPAIACLWPDSPPSHRITAVAVISHRPPDLFSGGCDGAIVRWTISGRDVRPLALLCGHAAEIADLAVCFPDSVEIDPSNPFSSRSALFSACTDGVLCVWGSGSFRCRRRRKLPPWAEVPSFVAVLPSLPSHVCVACCSGESSKSSILIVDSRTLHVVRTVFHGNMGVGMVKSVAIVPLVEELEKGKQAVLLVDGNGKSQLFALSIESNQDGEASSSKNRGSSSDSLTYVWEVSHSSDCVQAVEVARDGKLLAVIFESRCEFRSVFNGMVESEISLLSTSLCDGTSSTLTGGTFLYADARLGGSKTQSLEEASSMSFALWNSSGAAMLYSISKLDTSLVFEPICRIPAPLRSGERSSFLFCQFNDSLVRLESISFSPGHLVVWKPSITIWSITEFELMQTDNCYLSVLLGEGDFSSFQAFQMTEKIDENAEGGLRINEHAISSSLVLSEDFHVPYAVVYGFYNGEIAVAQFLNLSPCTNSIEASVQQRLNLHTTANFSGHTSAVICLAAHHMAAGSGDFCLHRILVSGSIDCTIRLWDLDSGSPLSVMHHHIAPVKQIILSPARTDRPWKDCFLSVGEDGCVALVSFETLRMERMFPGHPSCPSLVVWDGRRGYLACFCRSDAVNVLIIWDVKTGAQERIIRGSASHSMMDHFCKGMDINFINGTVLGGTTSASAMLLPFVEDSTQSQETIIDVGTGAVSAAKFTQSNRKSTDIAESYNSSKGKLPSLSMACDSTSDIYSSSSEFTSQNAQTKKYPVTCSCLFPGIATLDFDLSSLVALQYAHSNDNQAYSHKFPHKNRGQPLQHEPSNDRSDSHGIQSHVKEIFEGYLLRFSLCFLHLWDIDQELDKLLKEEMDICKPEGLEIAAGIMGDRGSMTLMFPHLFATLELWKSSSEFCAMRSLVIVSLAQRMIGLYHSTTRASSALAAFYTRNFAEKVPDIKAPSLQLLVSFWQDPNEHVRMAARSLFHCAAPRAIPLTLHSKETVQPVASPWVKAEDCTLSESYQTPQSCHKTIENSLKEHSKSDFDIVSWLDSFESHDWVSCIGGSRQDAMSSNIIVAAALVVWYPCKVKRNLAKLVADRLVKLVMATNDRFSATAAELLSEGMESIWKSCLGTEIPLLVGDIFFQIECISATLANSVQHKASVATNIQEALVGILLPSLAVADIIGFLNVIEGQIWSTSSDSPVHQASLKTLVRVIRGSPKSLALYLDKVVNYILQTMDPGNLVMRKACLNSSLLALKEIACIFPMVALNESLTRLAVGDAIGDIRTVTIRVYDVESVTKLKILDATGPLGLPSLLEGRSSTRIATAISALCFSPDGEGLVAFSENGLMIRWWSLGTAWWEKLSRNLVPVQCAKLIFVPPWEGFSPNSSRSSIMENIVGNDIWTDSEGKPRESDEAERLRLLLHNLDLSYRLQWVSSRNVLLTWHGQQLGTFPLRS